jgi:hypothetical protein
MRKPQHRSILDTVSKKMAQGGAISGNKKGIAPDWRQCLVLILNWRVRAP